MTGTSFDDAAEGSGKPAYDLGALAQDLRRTAPGAFAVDAGTRALYTTDASNYRRAPDAVLVPRHTDDLLAAVDACHRHGVPLVTRGGGTSVAGNAFGGGLLVDTSRHLTAIGEVDPEARTATVQPGVVLDDLRAAAAPHGLTFGPDPSTHGRCTLGGMIGNNACGSHSVAWGTTADNVESLDVLLPDGTRTTVGATSRDELARLAARPDRVGQLYAGLRDLTERHRAALRTQLPTLARRVSGYALDQLLPEHGTQVARALTGSEGTCAVVLGATLKLVEAPPARALVVLAYPDAPAAGDAVPAVLAHHPLTVEGLDRALVRAWQSRQPSKTAVRLPDGGAWLLVETGGADSAEAAAHGRDLITALQGDQRPLDARVVTAPAEQRLLWRIREEGAGVATRVPSASGGATTEAWPGLEDAAVPPERLGDYLRAFQKLLTDHGRQGLVYGHYGEGCLHVRIDFDLLSDAGTRQFRQFMEESADLIAAFGGSLSGEHGDGQSRSELLPRMFAPEICAAFTEFKELWDPRDLMNPGVIVRPARIDADLRPARVTSPPGGVLPVFGYPDDEGDFARAVRRCVGVGKCRQESSAGVMCPSFRATREEQHSTRGRAHLLSEMIDGDLLTDGWRSTEVREALDLCLSCKGCRSDCPVGVDMATYKAEFLHHHYAGRRRPASHYSMGRLPVWLRLLARARAAPLVNLLARVRPLAAVAKRLGGIAPERDLPVLPRRPFTRDRRGPDERQGDPERPAVMLWPDTFSNHLAPQVLHAAVGVLQDAGFRVLLPDDDVCCGLTWVSTGQLDAAKRVLAKAVQTLAPAVEAGIPVVGLEPSCTAALRSDLPELLPGAAAERTAAAVHTFAEFLETFAPHWEPPEVDRPALTQVHCHQHAVTGFGPDASLQDRMGLRPQELASGCCGLAGNFGFEKGHYELSQAIGEQALLPAVRAAGDDTVVLADGFSCRTQIQQGTGRGAQHLAEILWDAVRARRDRERNAQAAGPAAAAEPASPAPSQSAGTS